jgi:hypothetical protein
MNEGTVRTQDDFLFLDGTQVNGIDRLCRREYHVNAKTNRKHSLETCIFDSYPISMRAYQGDFEIHVTARITSESQFERFREWCRIREFKCVRIILGRGSHMHQPMATWRRHDTSLPVVVMEAHQCALEMNRVGILVARVKVEAAPDNEDVPLNDVDAAEHEPRNYFEHHVKLLRAATASREALLRTCEQFGAHLSHNALREVEEGQEERFVTLRCYAVGRTTSEGQLQRFLAALTDLGERIIEHESEYCVYDSNVELDTGWLPQA